MAVTSISSPVAKVQCCGSAANLRAYDLSTAGVSKPGSNEIVNKCQFAGPCGMALSFFWASAKLSDMRGQKVGNGQRVNMKVSANACPLKSLKLTACPSSLVK